MSLFEYNAYYTSGSCWSCVPPSSIRAERSFSMDGDCHQSLTVENMPTLLVLKFNAAKGGLLRTTDPLCCLNDSLPI